MITNRQRARRRAFYLEQDVALVLRVVRRQARKAAPAPISVSNVRRAVENGRTLLAYADRGYLSAVYGQAMLRAALAGELKAAGYTRTKRVGTRGGSMVRLWKAA